MQRPAFIVIERLGDIYANRPDRRNPAHAHTGTAFEVKVVAVGSVTLIEKGRNRPTRLDQVVVFDAGHQQVTTASYYAIYLWAQRVIVIAAYAGVTTGKIQHRNR